MSIAPYQQNAAQVAVPNQPSQQAAAVAQLAEWARGAQAAHQVAVNLVNTSFCPKHYQGKPNEATAAILAGLEVGLSPMASLQAFHSIQGTAAPKAITLRAIVQSKGHTLDVVESSSTRAVVVGRRNGTGTPQTSTWTIERATTAGYPTKNPNWKSQPEFMLIARATAEAARMVASDAILGIPYSVEELEDGGAPVPAGAEQVPPRPVRRKNPTGILPPASVAAPQTPAPAMPAAAESTGTASAPTSTAAPAATDDRMSQEQQARLLALVRDADIDDRWGWASGILGREVTSYGQLSGEDAAKLIADLENDATGADQ